MKQQKGNRAIGYKGYTTTPEYSAEDGAFIGRLLGISDVIAFEAESEADLEREFHEAVDDYLEFCAEIGKEPQRPAGIDDAEVDDGCIFSDLTPAVSIG